MLLFRFSDGVNYQGPLRPWRTKILNPLNPFTYRIRFIIDSNTYCYIFAAMKKKNFTQSMKEAMPTGLIKSPFLRQVVVSILSPEIITLMAHNPMEEEEEVEVASK